MGRDRDRTAAHAVGIVDQQYHHGNLRLTETPQVAGGGKVRRIDDCRGRGANLHGCHALPSIEGWADGRGPLRRAGPAHTEPYRKHPTKPRRQVSRWSGETLWWSLLYCRLIRERSPVQYIPHRASVDPSRFDTRPGDDFAAADIAAKCVHRFVSAGRQSPRAIEAGIDCSTGAIAQIADGVPTAIGTVILSLSRNGPMRHADEGVTGEQGLERGDVGEVESRAGSRRNKWHRHLIRPRPAIRQIASMRPLRTATISSCRWTVVSE